METQIVVVASFLSLALSQVYPGFYEVHPQAISENGSSATGRCLSVSNSGRVCNNPRSSVLCDGIPTLPALTGDTWAKKLLTLNTSTSSATVTFNYNTVAIDTGVEAMEVVMFNCPFREIGVSSIHIIGDGSSICSIYNIPQSCEKLVRICTNVSTSSQIITLNFGGLFERAYLAEITFHGSRSLECSPVGMMKDSELVSSGVTISTSVAVSFISFVLGNITGTIGCILTLVLVNFVCKKVNTKSNPDKCEAENGTNSVVNDADGTSPNDINNCEIDLQNNSAYGQLHHSLGLQQSWYKDSLEKMES